MNTPPAALDAVFDHAAMAARRIRDLLPIYRDLLGGIVDTGGDNQRVGYRAVQLRYGDDSRVELLEPLAGSTFLDSFLRRHPSGGLHHITFKVTSMEKALRALREHGYTVHGESDADPTWHEVFLHPRDAFGTLVQIAQPGPGYDERPPLDLDALLAGQGPNGTGTPSP
ncbi:MAG: VOC family protein [Sciscionella sp.]|nr:VOC family protein [Sciscionella sp.]